MSASREKQIRKEQIQSGWVDPKTVLEEEQRKQAKRNNTLYGIIAALFVVALIVAGIWRSGVIAKNATAVTIEGEKYTAADVSFYYQSVYNNFYNNYYYFASYMGLDTSTSLKEQTLNETAASWLGTEAGQTWHDYFLDQALQQMSCVQNALASAEAEGYTFSPSLEMEYEDSLVTLQAYADSYGMSVAEYLQTYISSDMTEKIYTKHLMRALKYEDYTNSYYQSLTYSDSEIKSVYDAAPANYDLVSYEIVGIPGVAESTTDADGNTVEPTEEESAAALEAAEAAADDMYDAFLAGETLETLAKADDSYVYSNTTDMSYSGDVVTEWLFDDSRKAGDSTVLVSGTTYYVVVFHDRYMDESPSIDVRHILVQPESGTLTAEDEGYEAEQAQLMADAVASAEALLAQWKAGEATEESFAALALAESTDTGSKYAGGLYREVAEGEMVEEFNDWCFDPSRKTGDTDVVETTYGAHVMYFVQDNLPGWKLSIVSELRETDYYTWLDTLSQANVERSDFGIQFVG